MSGAEATGIPDGARWTPLPDLLFARILPAMEDPVMVKAAMHVLWRIHRRERGTPPTLRRAELLADPVLRRGAANLGLEDDTLDARIDAALDGLVELGLLIEIRVAGAEGPERWMLVNGREGRVTKRRLEAGDLLLPELPAAAAGGGGDPRANIYALFEANIGMLTPMLAEELGDAEATYPADWIAEAIRAATRNNVRKWAYVRAILERWVRDGRQDGPGDEGRNDEIDRRGHEAHRGSDREAPYADLIER